MTAAKPGKALLRSRCRSECRSRTSPSVRISADPTFPTKLELMNSANEITTITQVAKTGVFHSALESVLAKGADAGVCSRAAIEEERAE